MAFENDTNAGRVQKMIEIFGLIEKSALSNRADDAALQAMMRPLIEALTRADVVGGSVDAPEGHNTPTTALTAGRAVLSAAQEARWRDDRAAQWRKARRMINALPDQDRSAMRQVWDCAPYPADPSRLLSVLHSYSLGRLDLKRPPFPLSRTDAGGARIADLFASSDLFVTILKARDIAEDPDSYPLAERHAAYHHLLTAASKNKDRDRAMADRVLASDLFLRLGELEDAHA